MSYTNSERALAVSRRAIAAVIVAGFALTLPLHTASAQLGGLVKRAKDKVVENQVDKQIDKRSGGTSSNGGPAPTFDNTTLELTSERVGQMIRGLAAGRTILDGRATLVARRDEAMQKSATLSSENGKAIDAYNEKRDKIQRCRNDAISASRDKRQASSEARNKELQAKALSDPAFREKAIALAQKMGAAQARGDTVELKKLAAEMGLKMDDSRPDTLAADAACGKEPAKLPVMIQMEGLDAQANALSEQIRQLEEKAATTEQKESGLTERQFFMARERMEAYLSAVKYKAKPGGFSPTELEALSARRADLEKVM